MLQPDGLLLPRLASSPLSYPQKPVSFRMDTTRFTKRIRVKCLPEEAFERWTTSKGLESWFLARASFGKFDVAAVGLPFKLEWSADTTDSGEVVAMESNRLFEFTWYEGRGRVRVNFSPVDTGTLIELTQHVAGEGEAQMQEFMDCRDGWTFYLTNLKCVMEGGLDLRDNDPDLPGLVNY
jgi:uncharacterized protein YndB with AHSA1/START domain